ncbi:MAG TPA: hypothetical protein VJB35_06630 [Candidatus Nanoarchaeia archaeon]|nr:hypothetical protein [Candidatus Nanoarchaeia archaeon]
MNLTQKLLQNLIEENNLTGFYFNPNENCLYSDRECNDLALIFTPCVTFEMVLNWGFTIITPGEFITRQTVSEKANRRGNPNGCPRKAFQ